MYKIVLVWSVRVFLVSTLFVKYGFVPGIIGLVLLIWGYKDKEV